MQLFKLLSLSAKRAYLHSQHFIFGLRLYDIARQMIDSSRQFFKLIHHPQSKSSVLALVMVFLGTHRLKGLFKSMALPFRLLECVLKLPLGIFSILSHTKSYFFVLSLGCDTLLISVSVDPRELCHQRFDFSSHGRLYLSLSPPLTLECCTKFVYHDQLLFES